MLPHLPFVVIDMNACRRAELVRPLLDAFAREGVGILFPMMADWELSKGASAGTIHASFRLLSTRPEAVSIAKHTRLLKGDEREGRIERVTMEALVHRTNTENLRSVMRGLHADTHEVDPTTVVAKRDHWRPLLDREDGASVLRKFAFALRSDVPQADANSIRDALNAGKFDTFRAKVAELVGDQDHLARFLRDVGYEAASATRIVRQPAFSTIHYVALMATALRWRVYGGIENATVEKLEAAMMDVEYATLAAFGRGYITRDDGAHGARDLRSTIVHVAREIWADGKEVEKIA